MAQNFYLDVMGQLVSVLSRFLVDLVLEKATTVAPNAQQHEFLALHLSGLVACVEEHLFTLPTNSQDQVTFMTSLSSSTESASGQHTKHPVQKHAPSWSELRDLITCLRLPHTLHASKAKAILSSYPTKWQLAFPNLLLAHGT